MTTLVRGFRTTEGGFTQMTLANGRIQAVGEGLRGDQTIDLTGKWVTPGFVDAHCHVLPSGLDLLKLNLEGLASREEVLQALLERHRALPEGQWLLAVHYDQTRFADAQHVTRQELDAVCGGRPVLLEHTSGHAGVANTQALELAEVGEDEEDPSGGEFCRGEDGRLNGVLLEDAHERVSAAIPAPSFEEMVAAILAAGEQMRGFGIVAAADMMTGYYDLGTELAAYGEAARRGCAVRTRLYLQWRCVYGPKRMEAGRLRERIASLPKGACDVRGVKVFADGAIGSATAAIHGQYQTTGSQGRLIYGAERLKQMVLQADADGWSVAAHSIGDRATDATLDALSSTQDPRRHRVEHAMILSDGQVDRIRALGCRVAMQPEFLMRFGHAYDKQLGAEVAGRLNRVRSVLGAGIPMAFSSDRPVTGGNPWDGIRMATHRPEGFDPSENVPLERAIELYTRGAAEALGDGETLGRLAPGYAAEYAVWDAEPAAMAEL